MHLDSKHRTAILVFAQSSQEESRRKNIKKGEFLFETLTKHTLKIVAETGVPFFHFSEKLQEGSSFGARFLNAIQKVFDAGYHNIITIGNDSPHLTKTHIEQAIDALNKNQTVLGPSKDGGFYLMGLHRKDFSKSDFEKLPWQTSNLYDQVWALFTQKNKECSLLPRLFDIDSNWDVLVLAKHTSELSNHIQKVLRSIISSNEKLEIPSVTYPTEVYYHIPSNKGSPCLYFS